MIHVCSMAYILAFIQSYNMKTINITGLIFCFKTLIAIVVLCRGQFFIKGPFFLRANEISYMPGRLFYRQEVFLGSMEDVHPTSAVVARCHVLDHPEFVSCKSSSL